MRSDRLVIAIALIAGACGKQIGDACIVDSDCDPNGTRICLTGGNETDGYCTIQGCDYNTCPSEAACIRFFTGNFDNKPCDADCEDDQNPQACADKGGQPTNDCSLDELCELSGHCVPRSSEVRYCMLRCSSDGDCRDGYECRDLTKMIDHGGQPVLAPGIPIDANAPKFCAKAPG
jgi:hypothetical protein